MATIKVFLRGIDIGKLYFSDSAIVNLLHFPPALTVSSEQNALPSIALPDGDYRSYIRTAAHVLHQAPEVGDWDGGRTPDPVLSKLGVSYELHLTPTGECTVVDG